MLKKVAFKSIFFLLLLACTGDDILPAGTELLTNSNLSFYPDSVFPWTSSQSGDIEIGVSKEVFMTGNRSLFIENLDSLISPSGAWTQTYSGPMPSPGSSVELTAFIKGVDVKNLTEGRVGVGFRVYPASDRNGSSGANLNLQGDFDWTLVRATLENFPADADFIIVNLYFPSLTTGTIYFDEISLKVK
jgi:hypothetical protein